MESANKDEQIIGEFYCEDSKRNVCIAFDETDQTVDIYLKILQSCGKKMHNLIEKKGSQRCIQEPPKNTKKHTKESDAPHKCLFCSFKDNSQDILMQHMLHRHANNKLASRLGTLSCPVCNHVTKNIVTHRRHLRGHLKVENPTYFCPVCPYTSPNKLLVIRHFKDHAVPHEEIKDVMHCPMCRMTTKHFGQHAKHHIGTTLPNNETHKFVNKKKRAEQVDKESNEEKTSE